MKVWWKSLIGAIALNIGLVAFFWMEWGRSGLAWGFLISLSIDYYLALYSPLRRLCPQGAERLGGRDPWDLTSKSKVLAQRLKIQPPEIVVWESAQIQSFVFSKWPGRATLGVSSSALKNLNSQELDLLLAWGMIALKSGRALNWTYLGLFLNLILIVLSSVDRILSWMVTRRINQPHGITLWLAAPLIFVLQRLFTTQSEFLRIDQKLENLGLSSAFSSSVIKKIHFQNLAHPESKDLSFAHLCFFSQLPRGGLMPLLRVQPNYKARILGLRGSYPV